MASFNRVVLVGNLVRDVELKYTQGGTAVTEIGMAVNDRRKSASGDWIDETTFVDVTLWGRTAEVASEYLGKGRQVLIEGRLKLDKWKTDDGQNRSKLRVVGERMVMLGNREGGGGGGGRPSGPEFNESEYSAPAVADFGPTNSSTSEGDDGSELPF